MTTLRLDQLMSLKTTIPLDNRYFNIQPPIHTPIQVQPFNLPNQPPSIPLRDVILERAMNTPDRVLLLRLLFILHRGWIEARMLAQRQQWEQLYDLTDALEPLPAAISRWNDNELATSKSNLIAYEAKYHGYAFQYSRYLDLAAEEPPPF